MSNRLSKPTVTIGIAAYNEALNIGFIIGDVLAQANGTFRLKEIIISSDGSTDQTSDVVKSISDDRIMLIENHKRSGKARGLNQIISHATGQILILFDADTRILDKYFIEKMINPIVRRQVGLTSTAIKEFPASTKFAKVLNVSMLLKTILFETFREGNNVFTCHGQAIALSRRFYRHLHYPRVVGDDRYCYLTCVFEGFIYEYNKTAEILYKPPQFFSDHQKQSTRFSNSIKEHIKFFPVMFVKSQFNIPKKVYIKTVIRGLPVILKYPLQSIAYLLIQLYINLKSNIARTNQVKWDMATSSKILNPI